MVALKIMTRGKKIAVAIIIVMLVIVVTIALLMRNNQPAPTVARATLGSVTQTVEFTGQVEAEKSVQLSFEQSGIITSMPVNSGDTVKMGQTLATLDSRSEELELAHAFADRAKGQTLAKLGYEAEQENTKNVVRENSRTVEKLRQTVRDAKQELDQAQAVWQQTVRENGDDSSVSQKQFSVVTAAQSAYRASQQALRTAEATARKTNAAAKASADAAKSEYIATLQAAESVAGISSLQATENSARLSIAKRIMTAPFAGVVTATDAEEGELLASGTPLLTLHTPKLIVTAAVAENDVEYAQLQQPATITFDALSDTAGVKGKIISSAPAAEIIEGVPTYKVTLELDHADARLRPGFTANITLHIAEKMSVITIPQRALVRRDGATFVRIKGSDGRTAEKSVTVGLTGSNGLVEITSGLNLGDEVIVRSSTP